MNGVTSVVLEIKERIFSRESRIQNRTDGSGDCVVEDGSSGLSRLRSATPWSCSPASQVAGLQQGLETWAHRTRVFPGCC